MQSEKLHAACDECRTRKLKCSGGTPLCARCEREKIPCHYSPQKQMGRPRKRRREGELSEHAAESQPEDPAVSAASSYSEIGMIPPTINDFSAYGDLQAHDPAIGALPLPFSKPPLQDELVEGTIINLDDFAVDQMDTAIDPSLWQQPLLGSELGNGATSTAVATPNLSHSPSHGPSPPEDPAAFGPFGPCTCFSIMFLTITDLQSMTNLSFPAVLPRLRQSMKTAAEVINCERCVKQSFSAIQNVQSSAAILSALAERFHKVLAEIDKEAQELEKEGKKKPYKIGDMSPQNMRQVFNLHSGTDDCPMSFDVQLEPSDWKKFAKQALKKDALGEGQGLMSLVGLLDAMELRQHRWHADRSLHTEERERMFGPQNMCHNKGNDATCLRMVRQIRSMVGNMEWE